MFSVKHGFDNNVSPSVIGHMHNLRFIPWQENYSKSVKSSIELGTLLSLIELDKYNKSLTQQEYKSLIGV